MAAGVRDEEEANASGNAVDRAVPGGNRFGETPAVPGGEIDQMPAPKGRNKTAQGSALGLR